MQVVKEDATTWHGAVQLLVGLLAVTLLLSLLVSETYRTATPAGDESG